MLTTVAYFLTVSIIFSVYEQNFTAQKTRTAMNAKISVIALCVKVIIYLLLHNLHDYTFNLMK